MTKLMLLMAYSICANALALGLTLRTKEGYAAYGEE